MVPFVAVLAPVLLEKTEKITINRLWIKNVINLMLVSIGIIMMAVSGSFVYNTSRGQFVGESINSSKLPEISVQIANRLLKLNKQPRAVFQYPLGIYIRE